MNSIIIRFEIIFEKSVNSLHFHFTSVQYTLGNTVNSDKLNGKCIALTSDYTSYIHFN